MAEQHQHDTRKLLNLTAQGDRSAANELVPLVYDELRRRAESFLRREGSGRPIDTIPLVHEAYLRLVNQAEVDYQGRTHFLALAALQMRRILVDRARRNKAEVHGGGLAKVTLHEELLPAPESQVDVLDLEDALEDLAELNPRQARIIELRFYAGLTMKETAAVLGIALGTVEKDWRMARAWLQRRLERGFAS